MCVPLSAQCDGNNDCEDSSDEQQCFLVCYPTTNCGGEGFVAQNFTECCKNARTNSYRSGTTCLPCVVCKLTSYLSYGDDQLIPRTFMVRKLENLGLGL